ncbi:NADH-quinone oxidoreductase subunit 5 family protein [Flindersiella endophytica]
MTAWLVALGGPAAAAVLTVALGRRYPRSIGPISVVGATLAFLASWAVAGAVLLGDLRPRSAAYVHIPTGGVPFDIAFRLDGLTGMVALLVTSVALAVQIYSVAYMKGEPRYRSYAAFVSVFTAAMLLVVVADDMLVLLVGWEVMGVCSYFLIGHHWERQDARDGAVKAFIVTRLGDIGFLFGIFVLGLGAGTFRISHLQTAVVYDAIPTSTATLATLLLLCGVVGKSAQFPLHVWLPDAMAGPTPISALIHAATMVAAGVFLVARLWPVFALAVVTLAVLAVIAAITMLGSALCALAETDVKRVLAWSTVSQLAYMLGGLAVGGYTAGLLHLLSHGAFKALLFLCAGVLIHAVGSNLVSAMGGLRRKLPVAFVTMTIGLGALAGVPPLAGFFSKEAVLGAAETTALEGGPVPGWAGWLVLVAGLATVALTAAYATRLWLLVFFGPRKDTAAEVVQSHTSGLMRWPLVVLAVPAALFGFVALAPQRLGSWFSGGTQADMAAVLRTPEAAEPHGLLHASTTVISLLLVAAAAGGVVLAWRRLGGEDPVAMLGRARPALQAGLGMDAFYARWVVRPVKGLARLVVGTDRDVVDFYVSGSGKVAGLLGTLLRRVQSGNVQTYVTLLLAGVVVIAVLAGR